MNTLDDYLSHIQKIADAKKSAAVLHFKLGATDCELGIYDKWYRYHTEYDGFAYDLGWCKANERVKNDNVIFING